MFAPIFSLAVEQTTSVFALTHTYIYLDICIFSSTIIFSIYAAVQPVVICEISILNI